MLASALFLRTGVIAAVVGMGLGVGMGLTQDPMLHPVYAHLNLVGWSSLFLFGLYYRITPAADGGLAQIHYVVAVCGLVLLVAGLAGSSMGASEVFMPLGAAGSLLTLASMAMFVWNVFSTTRSSRVRQPIRFEPSPSSAVLADGMR